MVNQILIRNYEIARTAVSNAYNFMIHGLWDCDQLL